MPLDDIEIVLEKHFGCDRSNYWAARRILLMVEQSGFPIKKPTIENAIVEFLSFAYNAEATAESVAGIIVDGLC